jgi:hypothetical protein
VQPSTESNHVPESEPTRKRQRASFDAGRPVPEIPGMMSSPAVLELQSSQYAPAASFSPMSGPHNNSYSLTALSMAAEYQALQGNLPRDNSIQHRLPNQPTLPSATVDVTFGESQNAMSSSSMMHMQGPTLEESLNSLTSFLDNEPLTSYHFSTLMSAEQPM